jgi:hypothetical protein
MNQKIRLGVIVMITLGTGTIFLQEQSTSGLVLPANSNRNAPIATSGDNIYVAWWTNKTGNNEVMFRASNDGGATFAKKINLSNTTGAESEDAQIAASGKNVFVTWWERNQTGANTPVMKISNDNGKSFGPMLKLASNDTISNSK